MGSFVGSKSASDRNARSVADRRIALHRPQRGGDQSYVADGLTENLIAELARIHGLMVIARTSVMKYKGTRKMWRPSADELRVGTIVEGSIRRIDNQVRINAQLIDVASQGHLWSQEYDLDLTEVFGIKSDIANRVAQRLNVQVPADSVSDCLRAGHSPPPWCRKVRAVNEGPRTCATGIRFTHGASEV